MQKIELDVRLRLSSFGTTPTAIARGAKPGEHLQRVVQEDNQLKDTTVGLKKGRDFSSSKLRDIELLLQQTVEMGPEIKKNEKGLTKHIQTFLYSTEISDRPITAS